MRFGYNICYSAFCPVKKMKLFLLKVFFIHIPLVWFCEGVTMKQFEASLDTLRSLCQPKFKVSTDTLDDLRKGIFAEDQELKCYTKCIAQMTGTLSKKGEVSLSRMRAQIDVILPVELRPTAIDSLEKCGDVQNNYKDSCEKTFYITKCVYDQNPDQFKFP